ncbi:putative LRR receptor-like serine/threonine-protein kinase [Dichanthelium oligosanthes]|uniref:Putative LRR receptor-like serine/threonine-protein kinase n=1 Tax=Dichanthelium oligosanthes TaxID=888268 RepID=A0A1E5WHN5_9POAL|nr:putative LRR receptor-like serine/threonine-protein kinase [Dichanthelium oligosanthes]
MTASPLSCCSCSRIFLLAVVFFVFPGATVAQMPGFVSIDCGGSANYTDELGLLWTGDAGWFPFGETATISVPSEKRTQYSTVRYFPAASPTAAAATSSKHCYTLPVRTRTRYLVRATFLYGNFDSSNVFPEFDLYLGASRWSTIVIYDDAKVVTREAVVLAAAPSLSVCLSNATTGQPFISTLELRQLNGSLYYTDYEADAFLGLSARINFGAPTADPVRYPDDPYDRIWESDMVRRANYLVDVAPGTVNVSTDRPVFVASSERPPQKVMQTAVVGSLGELTYRLDLSGFPGDGWAFSYFAEIEEFVVPETRKFKLFIPGLPDVSKPTVDIGENAPGKYRLYEPGFFNISLPFVLSFAFRKTNDSSKGPILNAFEIYKYIHIDLGSPDGKNLTGNIPPEVAALPCLAEIGLANNILSGPIPDLSGSSNLSIIHLENNQLTGNVPSYFGGLPKLSELYSGNMYLGIEKQEKKHVIIIISSLLGASFLLAAALCCYTLTRKTIKKDSSPEGADDNDFTNNKNKVVPAQKKLQMNPSTTATQSREIATETAHPYRLSELEVATNNFASRIGSGGFGIVYYGKLSDGKEIAVKVPTNDSYQGKKQFTNEVSLLSRIHHRNLVAFLGYCHEDGRNILVYEFMHNGTLKEHLHGRDKHISWIKRLEIAEDAAKGIEYLHTGCTPSIIHRDIKTSNILLDKQMRAKVSDFGLSKFAVDESHASTNVRGTLGYLDPQYYTSQQLTEKSDMYSFGIILLELISGRPPISTITFGEHFRNIGPWARFYYESGDIEAIIDPSIAAPGGYQDVQSIWKIAEAAVRCIDAEPRKRPCMPEVVKEIQDAMALERVETPRGGGGCPFSPAAASVRSGGTMRSHDMVMDNLLLMDDEDDDSFSGSVSKLKYPELR